MNKGFVITGTDTGIGKTMFAAALSSYLKAAYWKPVQAGLESGGDSAIVAALAPEAQILPEAYRLTTACSPHQAAALDGCIIDVALLELPNSDRTLVIEGAGGVLVPLNENMVFADVFAMWKLPVIIVARTALGTINHSLLTLEALHARDIAVHGIIFSGEANSGTERIICHLGKVRQLGHLPQLDHIDAKTLSGAFAKHVDLVAFS
jgi:dethiobiotin synthetase